MTEEVFVDTSTIPLIAIDRVEVLKEGATAIYGSDAVAGVVNFILRDEFEGLSSALVTKKLPTVALAKVPLTFSQASARTGLKVFWLEATMSRTLSFRARPYTNENAVSSLGRSFLVLSL